MAFTRLFLVIRRAFLLDKVKVVVVVAPQPKTPQHVFSMVEFLGFPPKGPGVALTMARHNLGLPHSPLGRHSATTLFWASWENHFWHLLNYHPAGQVKQVVRFVVLFAVFLFATNTAKVLPRPNQQHKPQRSFPPARRKAMLWSHQPQPAPMVR